MPPVASGYPRCNYPEDLFIDDVPLLHVARLSDVGPGKWHFDYAADRIYLGDDPTGKKVEISVTPKAFTGPAANVTLRNLTIEKYANPTQQATVELGTGWIIEDCEVRWNHFTGIAVGPRSIARRNHVHHNGCFGFHGAGDDILVANNEIAYNGFAGYDPFWGSGGSKWVYTSHLVVRGNFSHHNRGPGLWTDINNIHTLYENNTVEDNERGGIFHEISYDATIRNNTSRRNGTGKELPALDHRRRHRDRLLTERRGLRQHAGGQLARHHGPGRPSRHGECRPVHADQPERPRQCRDVAWCR